MMKQNHHISFHLLYRSVWYPVLLCGILLVNSCKSDFEYIKNSTATEIIVEPSTPSKTFFYDEFFDIKKIQTDALEFNEQSAALISKNYPRKIKFIDDYIFILEDLNRPLKLFNKSGEFISSVGRLGKDPGQVSSIYDFTIDPADDRIYILDIMNQVIKCYEYNGKASVGEDVLIPDKWELSVRKIEWTGDGFLLYSESGESVKKIQVCYFDLDDKSLINIDFKVLYIPGQLNRAVQFHSGSDHIWITKNFCDTLFIWDDGIIKPEYNIPVLNSFFPESSEIDSEFKLNYMKAHSIRQVLNSDHYLIVKLYQDRALINLYYRKDIHSGQLINLSEGAVAFKKGFYIATDIFYLDNSFALDYSFDLKIRKIFDYFSSLKKEMTVKQIEAIEPTYRQLKTAIANGNGIFTEIEF